MIFVGHPFAGARPPILEDEVFGVLLTLAATEAALRGRPGEPVLAVKIDLDPLPHSRLDDVFGAPRTPVGVLAQPENVDSTINVIIVNLRLLVQCDQIWRHFESLCCL